MDIPENKHQTPTMEEIADSGRLGNRSAASFYVDARLRLEAQEREVARLRKAAPSKAPPLTPEEDRERCTLMGLEYSRNVKSARLQELSLRHQAAVANPAAHEEFLAAIQRRNEILREADYHLAVIEAEKSAAKAREDAAASVQQARTTEAARVAKVEADLKRTRQAGAISTSIHAEYDNHGTRIK